MPTYDTASPPGTQEEQLFFDRVGGHATFERLVDGFFAAMSDYPELLALYSHDPSGARDRLLMFLEEYWGGPTAFTRVRGAPLLRMRHMPYKITERAAAEWLACMLRSIDDLELAAADAHALRDYMERGTRYLINAD